MSNKIEDTGFSKRLLRSAMDYILEGESVPNVSNKLSDAKLVGGVLNAIDIVIEAVTGFTVSATKQTYFELHTADAMDGVFTNTKVIATLPENTVVEAGDIIGRYTVNTGDAIYVKVNMVSDDTTGDGTVNVFPSLIPS